MALVARIGAIAAAGSISAPSADYAATVDALPGGPPLAHWRLGETIGTRMTDRKAGARHGTYTGTVTFGEPGLPANSDGAVDFAGTGSASVPHDAGLALTAFSLLVWLRIGALPSADTRHAIVCKGTSGLSLGEFDLWYDDGGTWGFHFQTASATHQIIVPFPLEVGQTHCVVIRADSTGFDGYVNGQFLEKNTGHTDAWASNDDAITFGTAPWALSNADITIDEVAIYPRVLTEAEAIALSQQTSAPIARDDDVAVPENTTSSIDVTSNDTFVGSKADLTVTILDDSEVTGAGDSVEIDENNDASYTAGSVSGDAGRSFTYRITDANGESNVATCSVLVQDAGAPPSNANLYVESDADTVEVNSIAALQAAIAGAPPGRNILMAPGTYSGSMTLNGAGTQANPVVIRPRDGVDTVTINSSTWTWSASAEHLILVGFRFNGGRLNFRGTNRIDLCIFRQITRGIWTIGACPNARISRCDFGAYTASATDARECIYVDPTFIFSDMNMLVDYCYFHDNQPNLGANAQETIRSFGRGDKLTLTGSVLILDHCLFRNISNPGEGECLSNKWGGCITRFCTFENVNQYNSLNRLGNNSEYRSNWIENMGGSAALNVFGENHLIVGNRFVNERIRVGAGNCTTQQLANMGPGAVPTGFWARSRNCRIIGNIVTGSGTIDVGDFWSNQTRTEVALNNNFHGNTGTINLDPAWQSGTTFDADNEPYTPAVKLTPSDVGLSVMNDPLA